MKSLLTLCFYLLYFSKGFSQIDSNFIVTGAFSKIRKDVPAKIISNSSIRLADTVLALIKGRIADDKNIELAFSNICVTDLQNKNTTLFEADSLGAFNISLTSGNYKLLFYDDSHGQIQIDSLKLLMGQMQGINVSLGSRYVTEEWRVIQAPTLLRQKRKKKL